MHVRTLIELAMQHTDRRSLRTFAELVGVSHTKVAQWKNGDFPIPDDRIRQIAKLAAQDPGPWLLLIKSEQEDGELGREWAKLAKRLGAIGLAVLCAIGFSAAMPGKAYAASLSENGHRSATEECLLCQSAFRGTGAGGPDSCAGGWHGSCVAPSPYRQGA